MTIVTISSPNHSHAYIEADQGIIREIAERFTFKPEGYRFTPSFKAGLWDGNIRLVDQRTGRFGKGLVPDVIDALESSGYTVRLNKSDFNSFADKYELIDIDSLKLGFTPHEYQITSVQRVLEKKRQLIKSVTGSGKSLIIALLARTVLEHDQRVLIVVPNISLVNQLFSDFEDYFKNTDWITDEYVQKIAEGRTRDVSKPIVITTWQSAYNIKDNSWFTEYDCVISDECHLSTSKSISSIIERCVNASIKVGLTGTLDGSKVNELTLKSLFGPVYTANRTSDLIDAGILTDLKINTLVLKHKGDFPKLNYQDEMNYLVTLPKRNKFICNLVNNTKGNTLILFQFVEKHGKVLKDMLEELCPGKHVHFVYGGIPGDERESIRKIVEQQDNAIILASYAVYSTGVNVKNIHNIVFASPSKGRIRVFQSIGRGLRKHESKDICTLYDIADDLRGSRKSPNHTLNHMMLRIKEYYAEGFNLKVHELEL